MGKFQKYLAKEKPLVTLEDILSTYRDKDSYAAKHTIKFLEDKGLLPLTYHSDLFPDINVLVSWIMWSGSIGNNSSKNPRPRINLSIPERLYNDIGYTVTKLDVSILYGKESSTLGKNGTAYARLLSGLNGLFYSQGTKEKPDKKVNREVRFPDYIDFLRRNYRHIHGKDKHIATKILADNLKVLLKTRMSPASALSYTIHLFKNKSGSIVKNFTNSVINLFNTVYPKIGLTYDSVSISHNRSRKRKRFNGVIYLNTDNVLSAARHYNLFKIDLSHEYHKFGKKVHDKGR